MTLFSSSAQGVPFKSVDAAASAKATESRAVFKNEDRPVFRNEAKQAGAFLDYVRALETPALPSVAVGQGLPTMAVQQPNMTIPESDRMAAIPAARVAISSEGQVLDNKYGSVKDPSGAFHRFGKIGLMWGAGPNGRGMPQPLAETQDIGKVVALENKNRLGEVTRLTYRASQKAAQDSGRELPMSRGGLNANVVNTLDLPKNADVGEKAKSAAGQKAAAEAQTAQINELNKQRGGPVPAPVSAYASGFAAAW